MTLFLKHFHDAINPNKVKASFIPRNGVFLKLKLKPILMKNIEEGFVRACLCGEGGISKVKKTYSKKNFSLNKMIRNWPKMT